MRKFLPQRRTLLFCLLVSTLVAFWSTPLIAQEATETLKTPSMVSQMSVLVGLTLLPFFVMLLTSFLKMVVVLALLRSALGVQQAPPNQVLNGIALILTIYVMFPVGAQIYDKTRPMFEGKVPEQLISADSADFILAFADEAKEPLRDFLVANTRQKQEVSFLRLAQKYFPEPYKDDLGMTDFIILIPAYVTSQVEDAFEIGVMIYLPFFIVDLVTSNILLAMGMMMLSPMTIALPLKLLLLVMLDGWTLLVQGLVMTFKT